MRKIVFLLLLLTLHARAGLFDDDEARRQVAALSSRLHLAQQEINQQKEKLALLETAHHRLVDIINQLNQIKSEISQLRGQIEVIQFSQSELTQRQNDLYLDVDNRVRSLEQAAASQKTTLQANEQASLDTAIALVKSGKYKSGATALSRFIKDHSQHEKLPAAHYWLGMAHTSMKEYKQAASAFKSIIRDAPDDPRAPDALLGLASLAASQGDKKTSRHYLLEILNKHPQSEVAATAKKALAAAN